jgi:hypothetical protein
MKYPSIPLAFLAISLAAASPSPALAQSGPVGIGFAQAEEGTWWCRDGEPGKALSCALDKCRTESGGQDCHPTRWCSPAGWSGLMTVWLPEFHSTTLLCGTSGEAALIGALKALCDGSPDVTRCDVIAIIDPDGNERQIDDASWPGPAIAETSEPTGPEAPEAPEPSNQ